MMPAMKAAQFNCPISAGTETNVLVMGDSSWIISTEGQVGLDHCGGQEGKKEEGLHSSSFSMERSKLSAALPKRYFHNTLEMYYVNTIISLEKDVEVDINP